MRYFLAILAALIICATAQAQTVKALSYGTNNRFITGTNTLTFSNQINFAGGDVEITTDGMIRWAEQNRINLETYTLLGDWTFDEPEYVRGQLGFSTNLNTLWTATNASNARSAVGLGATWLTNTSVTNFRTAIGLGVNDYVTFSNVNIIGLTILDYTNAQIAFEGNSAAVTRTNLSLGLPALTNTSNVTVMRALAGSTNTSHPYTGTINFTSVVGMIVSNGIIIEIEEP